MRKTVVKVVSALFPSAIVSFAYKQLTNPQVKKLRDHELAVLDKAHKESYPFQGFGTFQKEEEKVYFGITKPLNSWNPIWANVHYWQELWELSKKCKGLDKVKVFLKPPGWQPDYLGGFQAPEEIDESSYKKYDFDGLKYDHIYVFFVFLCALGLATAVLFLKSSIAALPLYATMFYLLATLGITGGLMENRKWLISAEYGRIMSTLVVALLYWQHPDFQQIMRYSAILTLANLVWFSRVVKHIRKQEHVLIS
jgi:uncharacterized membrane protein